MFPCTRCGSCCRKIGEVFFARHMARSDGVCKYFDESTNLCSIYAERPIFCNVDAYYEKFLRDEMSREEFYRRNKNACKQMQLHPAVNIHVPAGRILSFDELPKNLIFKVEN